MSNTQIKQSSQNNEESSLQAAPLAMTTKEATHAKGGETGGRGGGRGTLAPPILDLSVRELNPNVLVPACRKYSVPVCDVK